MKIKKLILLLLAFIIIIVGGIAGYVYTIMATGFDIKEPQYIYIDSRKDYKLILEEVSKTAKVKDLDAFDKVATYMKYPAIIKTGKYAVNPGMTVVELVRKLRSGQQSPQKITFNNIRTKSDLSARIAEQLMLSQEELDKALNSPYITEKYGFNTHTIACMFIPNTYEFYWDVNLDVFLNKMHKEYKAFWKEDKIKRAKEINLTPIQVSILASIVEEECTYTDEYPMVAGLYINRLNRGQRLQADPTVKFAMGDFGLRRILFVHLETDSPYNTYMYAGLPPGPIRIPSIKGLNAVLNYTKHNYIYMAAKDDFSGKHNFAVTLKEHEKNANLYRKALNERRIFQ